MRCKKILIITAIVVFWFSIANLPTSSAIGSDTSSLTCDFIAGDWEVYSYWRHCFQQTWSGDFSIIINNDCSWYSEEGTLSGVVTISGYTASFTFSDPFGCGLCEVEATVSCNEMDGGMFCTQGSWGSWDFERTSNFPEAVGAGFTADLASGPVPLAVNFTDQSTGDITSWSWDFGDGATSTEQNPSHTYTDAGTYTVSLAVTGPCGSDTEVKANFITVEQQKAIPGIPLLLLDD